MRISLRSLVLRLFLFVAAGVITGSASIILFYRYTLQATGADQKIITGRCWPITVSGSLIYLGVVLYLLRPLIRFAKASNRGEAIEEDDLHNVQAHALNLGPRMAILVVCFYMVLTPLDLAISIRFLGWPWSALWYAVLAGIFSGLLLIPFAINVAQWAVRPLLDFEAPHAASRRAGFNMNLRTKMLVTFMPLICAAMIFTSAIGYSQSHALLGNFSKVQSTFVNSIDRNLLADSVAHKSDPRIRSSKYFENRLGNLKYFYVGFTVVALIITLGLTLFSASEITRPVRVLSQAANRIKEGSLDEEIRLVTNDELSELAVSVNHMARTIIGQVKSMRAVVDNLREGIGHLDSTIETVLSVSTSQSMGASAQASAVHEASSIAEELLATSKQIAERAGQMDAFASNTLKASEDGGIKLDEALADFNEIAAQSDKILATMKALEDSFEKTFTIVEWIEEIAGQTQLLALNASLEAAGAKSQGRRFGVVADATHRLAGRALDGANEIRDMITSIREMTLESTKNAEAGRVMVAAGGEAIANVVEALKNISSFAGSTSTFVHEITLSTNQQSSASEQLAVSFSEVQEVAKTVEDGAKEIEIVISQLRSFAENLKETVNREFVLK